MCKVYAVKALKVGTTPGGGDVYQTTLAVQPQSTSGSFPTFNQPMCPHEETLVRWWRNAINEGGAPASWKRVEGWCYGATVGAMSVAAGGQIACDYDTACGIAFERELMAVRHTRNAANGGAV